MSTIPAFTFGGITRPALTLDPSGNIILDPAAQAFVDTYGTKALYAGCPPGTPFPPIPDLLTTPVDSNAAANTVAEGAAVNTSVGITASAHSLLPFSITYSLSADSSSGGFKIDPHTGVVTVADPTKIDFESSPGHAYSITVQATDGIFTTSQNFSVGVSDVAPSAPVDSNAAANTVVEGAAVGTVVGVTAHSTDVNGGTVTYSLTGDTSGGGFTVNAATGVVTVADSSKIDYESAPGHAYTVTVQASDGTLTSTTQTFTIAVSDVPLPTPVDTNAAANQVAEGAAVGTLVGLTATANDPNGPTTTYSLIGDTSGGGFTINAATGVVTVADPTKIDFDSAAGHAYNVTVKADDGLASTTQTFSIAVTDVAPSTPVDSDAAANTIVEGAANGSTVGVTAHSTDINGPAVTYSLSADSSGGGFTINAATGVVTVADSTKVDFETAAGHAYTITAQANDGTLSSSQTFTIAVTDVPPSTPVDSDATANSIVEGAAAGSTVGITASATDVNGPAVTYSLTGDTSGGGFTINATTGVVTVADPTKIDYESSPGHAYTITATASDGTDTSSQTFTIGVTDAPPSTPVDSDATANSVVEGAAAGSHVGITASAIDVNGPAVTYSLTGDTSGGGFTINATTGVVIVADPTKIDYESSPGHAYTITATASDGTDTSSQTFTIGVADAPPSTPVDADATGNSVVEGAAAGTTVGITASATDVNGPAVTYSLTGDTSGGGFTINAVTGVVTVADPTKIDYESSPGHAYTITATASDGTDTSSQTFTIGVTDAPPSTPVDSDATADSVAEGAAAGTTVGVTVSSTDVNGPPVIYSLTSDTSGGGFTINPTTGVITVADPTKIDFESSGAGHSYTVTAQASDGTDVSLQTFTIGVTDVAPSTPVDADATANLVAEGAANGSTVGVTVSSTDVNGPAVTYLLTGDTSGGGFTINAITGVVTVADPTKIDFESSGPGHSYIVTAQASDGTDVSSQTFTIGVTDVAPSTPVDSDAAVNQVSQGAPAGTHVGVTASSTDVNGPAVTYSLIGDTSGGGFTIDSATGVVTVADPSKVIFNAGSPSFDVTVDSSDGTMHSQQTFTINVLQNTPPVANDDSVAATEAGGLNNSIPGSNPSGNVILGTGAAGDVQDTDAQDPSNAPTVVAVHTGPEGASTGTGTVGSATLGLHGTLTLNTDGSYTYLVNQTDAQVQALHTSAETITDQFNYTIQDTGGLQDTATLTITIHGADDLPQAVADTGTMTEDDAPTSFNVIANDTQDPDHTAANAITVGPGTVTVTGPGGETFANTDATATIVSNQVQVTLNNAHFQQLAVGEHATITVPYTLTGDVGETSSANLVVTVNGVNDVPIAVDDTGLMTEDQVGTFTVLANDTLDADHGAPNNVTIGAVANLVAPSGENIDTSDIGLSVNGSNQVVVTLGSDFQHMQDGQTATFDVPYTLHGDQAGDTSSATLHVTVNGVNDAPTLTALTFNGANSAIYNTDLVVHDPGDTAPDPAGPQRTVTLTGGLLNGASDVDGPNALSVVAESVATSDGGHVTVLANGDFTYTPKVGTTATTDTFTYTVTDGNTGASGPGNTVGTATVALTAPHVWYVNADAATDGDGSSEKPFNTLTHFAGVGGVDGAGDTIVLETASTHYTGTLTLENNEQLISQSAGVTVDGTTLFSASGANAVLDGNLVLGTGNTVEGVDFGTTSGFSVSGSSVGTLHLNDTHTGVINNSSGGGISITGSSNVLNVDFNSITSGGGTNGITINGASGTFHAHGGTISGASGSDVALNASTLNFTDDGAISDNTGGNVSVSNMTGGTQSFTGAITGNGSSGISLSSNTGATIDFSGGVTLSTGAANAFSATGGGTVNVTGTNHLTTTSGTALDIANTTIGTSGLTFHDISSNGAASGIVLNNTGSGSLTVSGDGGAGSNHSGGQIVGSTGSGVSLTTTGSVTLGYLDITNSGADGVNASGVNGFTLNRSNVSDNAGGATDEGLQLTNISGALAVTNSAITNAPHNGIFLHNTNTNLTSFTVTNTQITDSVAQALGNDGILIETSGTTVLGSANISGSTFSGLRATGLQVSAEDTSRIGFASGGLINGTTTTSDDAANSITVQNNTFSNNNIGVDFSQSQTANEVFQLLSNTITGDQSHGINVASAAGADTGPTSHYMVGKIDGNTIGTQGVFDSGSAIGFGLRVAAQGDATHTFLTVNNNTFHEIANQDVMEFVAQDGAATTTTGQADFKITNNTITAATGTNQFGGTEQGGLGIFVLADETMPVKTIITGNNISTTQPAGEFDVYLAERTGPPTGATLSVEGTGSVSSFIIANNTLNDANKFFDEEGNATLAAPGSGTFPLLSAPGGVQATTPTPGETNLTQAELNSVVAAAIAEWAHAGASASQLAALQATTFSVADLTPGTVGEESTPAHITIDVNADGHGWFIDPTPSDNSEFTHAVNNAGTDLLTDPSNAAAGHLDLLTTVAHELGHVLGLDDKTSANDVNDLMYISLVDGERRVVTSADVVEASTNPTLPMTPAVSSGPAPNPPAVAPPAAAPVLDAGHGGGTLIGTAGADNFVFSNVDIHASAPPPVTQVANYSFAQGDTFDFSALTSAFHSAAVADTALVRAVESPSGSFATLQVSAFTAGGGPMQSAQWVNVAQIDGAHAGDPVNVLVDSQGAVHHAQIHVDLLV